MNMKKKNRTDYQLTISDCRLKIENRKLKIGNRKSAIILLVCIFSVATAQPPFLLPASAGTSLPLRRQGQESTGAQEQLVSAERAAAGQAKHILDATGVRGGLIIHIGCGDGKLTAALHANDSYLVHGLDAGADNIEKARKHIRSLGLEGPVSVDRLIGDCLPYTDNLVNLIVSQDLGQVSMDEVMRVLCPRGVAYIKRGDTWMKKVKLWPKEIDEWTHYLHDATNNAVSKDSVVAPPHHIQWVGGPEWARSHDHLASVSVVVSSGGRIFYIVDEGPIAAVALPADWFLVARDAFNGVVLWKKPIGLWEGHLRGFRSGPAELSRRLVAVGEQVFVTLGYGKPLTVLDAATGEVIRTYQGTDGTLEIVYANNVLYLVTGEIDVAELTGRRDASPSPRRKRLTALEVDTGAKLWEKADSVTDELMPLTLAVAEGRVFFQNPDEVVCLDARTGGENWRVSRPIIKNRWGWSTPTLVVYEGVVLSADRAARSQSKVGADSNNVEWNPSSQGGEAPRGELIAFSAQTGQELWRCDCRETYNAPVDVLVTGGLVWTGDLVQAKDPGITLARDVITGQVKKNRPPDHDFFTFGMGHHRCYRNKATEKYLLLGRSGVEFVDLDSGQAIAHHFIRGTCQYGIFPGNGLLYTPPHSCACFIEAKLNGFNALAPKRQKPALSEAEGTEDRTQTSEKLEKGPAYGQIDNRKSEIDNASWPTYRHDIARSGYTSEKIPANLKNIWQTQLSGRLSSPVAAEGMIFVASIDSHTVHALDAGSGKQLWSYTTGGRADSPPTIYQGMALFGSADGYVYCVRAADGKLAWRFRAAPQDRRIVSYGQLESVWPVHGSVLVLGDIVYFAAGRSSYLDGGMYLYRLSPRTGKEASSTNINNRDPQSDLPPQNTARGVNMPGALPDVLSSDGQFVYMRHMRFNREGAEQKPDVPHLFSPAGFLDDSWWHRTYWLYGTDMNSGWSGWPTMGNQTAAGQLLVLDESSAYGFGRLNQYATHGSHVGLPESLTPWPPPDRDSRARGTVHYRLFACSKQPEVIETVLNEVQAKTQTPAKKRPATRKEIKCRWSETVGLWVRAMVLADKTLFLAGPPDVFTDQSKHPSSLVPPPARGLACPRESGDDSSDEGRRTKDEGILYAVSAEDGKKLAEYKLESPPVFDGMIAANGRLYISTRDGRLLCMGENK